MTKPDGPLGRLHTVGPSAAEDATAFVDAMYPRLFGALGLYTGDAALAEELTQEVMLRLWRSWPTVSTMEHPDRWALHVGFNLAKSSWRRRRTERRSQHEAVAALTSDADATDALAVRAAVLGLPKRQRAVVILRYFNDLSVAETARVLRCAEGTVKAMTSHAIANLKAALHSEFDTTKETFR